MDSADASETLSEMRVPLGTLIETVAEAILGQDKPVGVVNPDGDVVGTLHSSHVLKVLFGERSD